MGWGHVPWAILSSASSNVSLWLLKILLVLCVLDELRFLWGEARWVMLLGHKLSCQHALVCSICPGILVVSTANFFAWQAQS